MFPTLSLLFIHISTQSLLLSLGVLAALATAERLAAKLRLRPDRIWTASLLAGASLAVGERLILFLRGWRDFIVHPFWMFGLMSVRDQRYFYVGAAVALLVCTGYLLAHRISLSRAAEAMLPAVGLLLGFVHTGYFAAGAEPGRATTPRWGLVSTNHVAYTLYGTPMQIPLLPVAAYAGIGYAILALLATWLVARGRPASGFFLITAGLLTVLIGQLQFQWSGEPLLLGIFTWAQGAGVLSTLAGAVLLIYRR